MSYAYGMERWEPTDEQVKTYVSWRVLAAVSTYWTLPSVAFAYLFVLPPFFDPEARSFVLTHLPFLGVAWIVASIASILFVLIGQSLIGWYSRAFESKWDYDDRMKTLRNIALYWNPVMVIPRIGYLFVGLFFTPAETERD